MIFYFLLFLFVIHPKRKSLIDLLKIKNNIPTAINIPNIANSGAEIKPANESTRMANAFLTVIELLLAISVDNLVILDEISVESSITDDIIFIEFAKEFPEITTVDPTAPVPVTFKLILLFISAIKLLSLI